MPVLKFYKGRFAPFIKLLAPRFLSSLRPDKTLVSLRHEFSFLRSYFFTLSLRFNVKKASLLFYVVAALQRKKG
jgi:hypothetical protein